MQFVEGGLVVPKIAKEPGGTTARRRRCREMGCDVYAENGTSSENLQGPVIQAGCLTVEDL
jgi:hypothetical protein